MIHDTEECPFCAQGIRDNALVSAYRACFSEAYTDLRSDIEGAISDIAGSRRGFDLAAMQKIVSDNEARAVFWRDAGLPVNLPEPGTIDDARAIVDAYFDAADDLVAQKKAAPLDPLEVPATFRATVGGLRRLRSRWRAYNQGIARINKEIQDFKYGLDAGELAPANAALSMLRVQKERHSEDITPKCEDILRLQEERRHIVDRRDAAQAELNTYNSTVMPTYSRNVNARLKRFGVDFRICDLRKTEQGRSPNAMYQIEINRVPVALGNPDEDAGSPSFRCTLSSGERSALAFALFMAQIESHQDKNNLTVVFDDPFSSMDAFRLEQTAAQIRRLTADVKQVVVLSHSNEFLARVHDGYVEAGLECRLLQIERGAGGGSRIAPWDIVDARKSTYEKHFEKLRMFDLDGEGQPLDVVLHVRQTLEFDLRRRYGSALAEASWLGEMIGMIREAQEDSPLREIWPQRETLEDVNEYVKRYYHGPERRAIEDHPPIDGEELRTHVRMALDFVHPPQV